MESKTKFKYNLSFYYQSTIVYLVVFIIISAIKGKTPQDDIFIKLSDPIIYFCLIIVIISLISLVYNLILNKYIIVDDKEIIFKDRFSQKRVTLSRIEAIRFRKDKSIRNIFGYVLIKLKDKKRILFIRPTDYESPDQLIKQFSALKEIIEKKYV